MHKKQLIYRSALELFVNKGFYGTPTAAIAKKAGVANGTLFHYFPTKELLINALYLEVKDNFLLSVTENYIPEDNFQDRIRFLWNSIIKWAISEPLEFRFIQQFSCSPFINHLTEEKKTRHTQFFKSIFKEGLEKNILKHLPVELLMQMSLTQVDGLIEYIYQVPTFANDQNGLNMAFDCYWEGIGST